MQISKLFSFIVVASLIAVVFAGLVSIPAGAQTDTMQFRYNAAHTGDYSPVAGSLQPTNQLKWNYTTGRAVQSSPAVANGLVYFGSNDGNFYAVDIATGQLKWFYPTTQTMYSSPAVVNGVVYFTSGAICYALDAASGALKWKNATFNGQLTIANGVVYTGLGDGNVRALDAASGALKWVHTIDTIGQSSPMNGAPAVVGEVVYVGGSFANKTTSQASGIFCALDVNDGKELWNYTSPAVNSRFIYSPAVYDGVVYVGLSGSGQDNGFTPLTPHPAPSSGCTKPEAAL